MDTPVVRSHHFPPQQRQSTSEGRPATRYTGGSHNRLGAEDNLQPRSQQVNSLSISSGLSRQVGRSSHSSHTPHSSGPVPSHIGTGSRTSNTLHGISSSRVGRSSEITPKRGVGNSVQERNQPHTFNSVHIGNGSGSGTSRNVSSQAGYSGASEVSSDFSQSHIQTYRRLDATREERMDLDIDAQSQIYMSIMWHAGKLAAAYYDADSAVIHMLKDIAEIDNFEVLQKALKQVSPQCVIVSSKADERFLKAINSLVGKSPSTSTSEMSDVGSESSNVQFLPSIDFSLEVCKRRILSTPLPSIPDHFTEADRTIFMSSLVPFDCACLVRALGGLLKFLEKMRVGIQLESLDTRVPILTFKIFSLQDLLSIDDDTYTALQIFQKENHPSVFKTGGSGAKEGLSLFGILNRTRSVIGSKMMRVWFLRPSRDLSLLQERQDAVSFLVNPRNVEVANVLYDSLKHIRNVPRILKLMQQAQASVGDWQALYKTAYSATNIRDVCKAQPDDIAIFHKISEAFTDDLHYVASLISKIVDFEESVDLGRFVVKPNVDPELDKRKRTYNGLPDLMTQVAREELNRLSEDIEECNVIYLPQLGYLLAIPCTAPMVDTENYDIPGLEFVFMSNNKVHYKSERTKALDMKLGDTQCEITDHETEIMHKLQNIILERSDVFLSVMDYAAELDCLLAFAAAAKDNNYICPRLTKENVIDIQGGRHPLQELCITPFVPNDTHSSSTKSKVKFLTGPNASGKSVYLKQVGLICFMAHIGSFVPAELATIGMIDGIYTRVHTQESVSVGLSTFMIDLNQMSTALHSATNLSLVIVDEFGKGTDGIDGSALLVACIKHWLTKKGACPHLFISTHFHGIVKQKMLPESSLLQFQTMEVLESDGEMVFLYQLIDGHANYSYASHIATLAGIPDELVARGKKVAELIKHNKPIHRADAADTEAQYLKYQEIASTFMDMDLDTIKIDELLEENILKRVGETGV